MLTLDDFREVFNGGLTPGGFTAEEFDVALKVHDAALLERAAEVAVSVRDHIGGMGTDGTVYRYMQARYPHEGPSIAREIRALSASTEPDVSRRVGD